MNSSHLRIVTTWLSPYIEMSSYVKGGAWTNIEDEILKAAVQKYGTNQWARVSSLLPKKTATQAKSRWVEWLNPLINKTGWTSDQDKRLIELTRLLPNQWRSIGSIIGRTATQCVERYQQLIDEASGNDSSGDLKLSGPGIETIPAIGQPTAQIIDNDESNGPNFAHETQPAQAGSDDDESMEDDDREMLAEAKARLSNTQGKKAKRKARERMLEESKRLALLQKRRDMKAAGLNVSLHSKNKQSKKEFDYNADIPHEIVPPSGPYDVSEENRINELELEQFQSKVAQQGIGLKEVDDKIEAVKEKQRVEKKRRRTSDAEKELEDSNLARGIEFKKLKFQGDQPVAQKTETESSPVPEPLKKPNKALASLMKSLFEKLPEPKHHEGKLTPVFNVNQNELESSVVLVHVPGTTTGAANPQVSLRLGQGKCKQRRTRVIQKGLPIPDPLLVDSSVKLSEVDKVQEAVAKEFTILLASDYRKSRDPSFSTSFMVEVDEKIYDKVNKEIDDECRKLRVANEETQLGLPPHDSQPKLPKARERLGRKSKFHKSLKGSHLLELDVSGQEANAGNKEIQTSPSEKDSSPKESEGVPFQSSWRDVDGTFESESRNLKLEADRIFDRLEQVQQLLSKEI